MTSAPSPTRRIRPAGWVVILLFVAGLLYLGGRWLWPRLSPLIERNESTSAEEGTKVEKPLPPPTLTRTMFPASAASLPSVSGSVTSLALAPLAALSERPADALAARSEQHALELVRQGQARYTVVSVPALAAFGDADLQPLWSLGPSSADLVLFPSCAPASLQASRLGAERGSSGHLALLAAFVGLPRIPDIALFDGPGELSRAIGDQAVTGGANRALEARSDAPPLCPPLPEAVTTHVVVHHVAHQASAAEVASIVALFAQRESPEEVAAFFDPRRSAPGGFFDIHEKSQQVWLSIGLLPKRFEPLVDRTLLDGGEGAFAGSGPGGKQREGAAEYGRPAWPDRARRSE